MDVHFSSASVEWATPQCLFDELDAEFNFELDVCATAENAKCARYFTAADDGLAQPWTGVCWMNPPYDAIKHWMAKARESAQAGATVVCLVPARPGPRWWHDHCPHGEIRILRGRLKFGNGEKPAPFASAVVIFRPGGVGAGSVLHVASRNGSVTGTCRGCGARLPARTRRDARYCSSACRQRAYRKRGR
jgi:phage N-6-adenine-methyltransferase